MPVTRYQSTKSILEGLVALAASCASPLALQTLATTSKGWPLTSASIGSGPTKVLLTFGIHGREYMTSEIAVHFLNQLCSGDEDALLKDVTFTMLPVFNPDGRARTDVALGHPNGIGDQACGDRRKNGRLVDLNRNFDWAWDKDGASSADPSSTSYRGTGPNSEVEAQTLDKLAGEVKPDMYIDIHTGTLAMYTPWNHNSSGARNNDEAMALLERVLAGADWYRGRQPRHGVGGIISYLASGTAADFVFAAHHPRYSFIWETYLQGADLEGTVFSATNFSATADMTAKLPRGDMAHKVVLPPRKRQMPPSSLQPQELRQAEPRGTLYSDAASDNSEPSEWMGDGCFEYFNPTAPSSLEGWVNSWTDALFLASRELVKDMAAEGSAGR